MAIGDLKGDECIVVTGIAGETLVKGDTVHLETDGFWDKVVDNDVGKFGVAIEAAATGESSEVRVCIWGPIETTATGTAIKQFSALMPGTTGRVELDDNAGVGQAMGTAMTAFDASGVGTVFVGLVG